MNLPFKKPLNSGGSTAILFVAVTIGSPCWAQEGFPFLSSPLADINIQTEDEPLSIDLAQNFALTGVDGQVVQFDTNLGGINIELLASDAPGTVQNFLNYAEDGDYDNSVFHRSVADFIVQGGGFTILDNVVSEIPTDDPIANEFSLSNLRGTVAMAKLGNDPDSATNQFFFNVSDNSENLDNQNGGFTVFARAIGSSMDVVDEINALDTFDASASLNSAFGEVPLLNPTLTEENLIKSMTVSVVSIYPDDSGQPAILAFAAGSSNPDLISATITGSTLQIAVMGSSPGTATITVTATDTHDNSVESSFAISVASSEPASQSITFDEIDDRGYGTERVSLAANATSGLPVSFAVVSGPGLLNPDNTLSLTGPGTITVRASQPGNTQFQAAPQVDQSFTVTQQGTGASALLVEGNAKLVNMGTIFDGNTYNGFELAGETASFSSIAGEITRISFLELDGDLMFAEFGSDDPSTVLMITLGEFQGPAVTSPYLQPGTVYAKGHPSFEIQNSTALTFVSFFSLGNDRSRVDISLIRDNTLAGSVDGIAEIKSLTINDGSTEVGGINAANANFSGSDGIVGIDAPDVMVGVFLFVGNITPSSNAQPAIRVSSNSSIPEIRITGGDLAETTGEFQIDTNGEIYSFPFVAADGQRSISNTLRRPDLGDGRLEPVTDTFLTNINLYFVTDGQVAQSAQ